MAGITAPKAAQILGSHNRLALTPHIADNLCDPVSGFASFQQQHLNVSHVTKRKPAEAGALKIEGICL
jgi:hypothetical protein